MHAVATRVQLFLHSRRFLVALVGSVEMKRGVCAFREAECQRLRTANFKIQPSIFIIQTSLGRRIGIILVKVEVDVMDVRDFMQSLNEFFVFVGIAEADMIKGF